MTVDTLIGGSSYRFPETGHTVIGQLASEDAGLRAVAYEKVVAAYWKPAYKYLRLKWKVSNEDANDLIQGFFTRAIDDSLVQSCYLGLGSVRTGVLTFLY